MESQGPYLGDDMLEMRIAEILVEPGQDLAEYQPYMCAGMDKADVELIAPFPCRVQELHVSRGATVRKDDPLVTVESLEEEAIGEKSNITNTKTALHWIATKSIDTLCTREACCDLTEFSARLSHIQDLSEELKELPIHRLPHHLSSGLETALFPVTVVLARLERFQLLTAQQKASECMKTYRFVSLRINRGFRSLTDAYFNAFETKRVPTTPKKILWIPSAPFQ